MSRSRNFPPRAAHHSGLPLALAALLLTSCGDKSRQTHPADAPATTTPRAATSGGGAAPSTAARPIAITRVPARPGEPVIVPLAPGDRALATGLAAVRIEGHPDALAPLWLLAPGPAPAPTPLGDAQAGAITARVRAFLGLSAAGPWRSVRASGSTRSAGGPIVAAVELPEDARPATITIDGHPITLDWPADSDTADAAAPATRPASPWLSAAIDALSASSLTRWRARLAAGAPLVATSDAPDTLPDDAAEGLARALEAEWSRALAALDAADTGLAARVRARLAGVVDFGQGVRLPVWTGSPDALDLLRSALADPSSTDDRRRAVAGAWLATLPNAGAAVLDDAATLDPARGAGGPGLLLINLSDAPASAWADRPGEAGGTAGEPDLHPLDPQSALRIDVPPEARRAPIRGLAAPAAPTLGAGSYAAGVGPWTARRTAVDHAVRAAPPGFALGPTLVDWTLDALLASATEPSPAAPLPAIDTRAPVAGRLYRAAAGEAGNDGPGAAPGRWMIYLERAAPADAPPGSPPWEITLHFGAANLPADAPGRAALRVRAGGALEELVGGRWTPAGRATMTTTNGRTALWVPVPAHAIEGTARDGSGGAASPARVLRLGLTHVDERARRSAWPRPMLPWQTEPGRLAVDLSTWSPVE
jgi:hypothetical protein